MSVLLLDRRKKLSNLILVASAWHWDKILSGLKTGNQADLCTTRPSALGMSDPIWGPLIHIFVDEKKN